jgi:predicted Zn-dependent peptidase
VLALPEPEVHTLGPAAEAWYVRVPQVRKVAVEIVLQRGMVELAGHPTEALRALGSMAEVAGGELDAAEMSEQRDLYDIELDTSLGLHVGRVSLRVPAEDFARGIDMQAAVLREATFPKKELARYLSDQELFYTVSGPSSQSSVARSAMAYTWFPADHPYGRRPDPAALSKVKGKGLLEEYAAWRAGAPIVAVVVGDVAWSDVESHVKALVDGLGSPGEAAPELPFEPPATSAIVAVEMPGQTQVAVRLRLAAPRQGDPDRAAYEAASWVLGGHFLSRLNTVLREEKGYTYGADASYQNGATWGMFTVAVDVRGENLLDTLRTIDAELAAMAEQGPDEAEMVMARRSLAADWNDLFLTADTATRLYLDVLDERSTVAAHRARIQAIEEMSPADVQRAAATWFGRSAARTLVVVGDRGAMTEAVTSLGLPVTWTDPSSAILGTFGPPEG